MIESLLKTNSKTKLNKCIYTHVLYAEIQHKESEHWKFCQSSNGIISATKKESQDSYQRIAAHFNIVQCE